MSAKFRMVCQKLLRPRNEIYETSVRPEPVEGQYCSKPFILRQAQHERYVGARMMQLITLRHSEFISESFYSTYAVILNMANTFAMYLTHTVILNLFQDTVFANSIMLKQVQHDEFFVEASE